MAKLPLRPYIIAATSSTTAAKARKSEKPKPKSNMQTLTVKGRGAVHPDCEARSLAIYAESLLFCGEHRDPV
jgi:hypothetical protein